MSLQLGQKLLAGQKMCLVPTSVAAKAAKAAKARATATATKLRQRRHCCFCFPDKVE